MNIELAINDTIINLKKLIEKIKKKWLDLSKMENFIEKKDFRKFAWIIWWAQVSWSISPFVHTYNSLNKQKENFLYILINMEQQWIWVKQILQEIEQNKNILGLNVTMPYKIDTFKILEEKWQLDDSAILVWATNTLSRNEKWQLIWYNSDIEWIILPIKNKLKENIKNIEIWYILWSGWAARATISALLILWITDIIILARKNDNELFNHFNNEKIKKLLKDKYWITKEISIKYEEYDITNEKLNKISKIIDKNWIIINTLPFWFKENLPKLPILENEFEKIKDKISLFFDVVYDMNYWDTQLIQLAKQNWIPTCDWIDMLLNQAVKWFNLWTKWENLDLEVLEKAFR